tara:strand:- start:4682 stop:5260 length:579 start_codon:yes stop_codon:yes gene_type:complete
MTFAAKTLTKSKVAILCFSFFLIQSCGLYKKVDARKVDPNVDKRVEKNIQEGRGFRVLGGKKKGGSFEFASSNEMWRASINLLDFTPLSNVDYSGGIIITDWFADENSDGKEYLKITVRFLSNEIRSDGLKVIIHKKTCINSNNCNVSKIDTTLANEIKLEILKEAAKIKAEGPSADPDFKMPTYGDNSKKK